MSQYEVELYKDPGEAAYAIADLMQRMAELEAEVQRLKTLNRLRDTEY